MGVDFLTIAKSESCKSNPLRYVIISSAPLIFWYFAIANSVQAVM